MNLREVINELSKYSNHLCYFRSSIDVNRKKVLIQITERCNLSCVHCFVSSESKGKDISVFFIKELIIPYLKRMNVERVTLTGGEPFLHKNLFDIIDELSCVVKSITICTNGTLVDETKIKRLKKYGKIKINVSLDGFSDISHDKFRGKKGTYNSTIKTIEICSKFGILGGILVTPNRLSNIDEYILLCKFALKANARYVLFNPLSSYGRGAINFKQYTLSSNELMNLRKKIENLDLGIEVVFANFPSKEMCKENHCIRDRLRYIFATGKVVGCPYIQFAKNEKTKYLKITNENEIGILNFESFLDDNKKLEVFSGCVAYDMQSGEDAE